MGRLIDTDTLHYIMEDPEKPKQMDYIRRFMVDKAPTVDAEPIRHGHWIRTEAYPHRVVCSECHRTYVRNENIIEGRYKGDEIVPIYCTEAEYCPHCGAKMDEVEEDE